MTTKDTVSSPWHTCIEGFDSSERLNYAQGTSERLPVDPAQCPGCVWRELQIVIEGLRRIEERLSDQLMDMRLRWEETAAIREETFKLLHEARLRIFPLDSSIRKEIHELLERGEYNARSYN